MPVRELHGGIADRNRQEGGVVRLIQEVAPLPDPANIGRGALDPRKPHSLSVTAPSGVIHFAINIAQDAMLIAAGPSPITNIWGKWRFLVDLPGERGILAA